MKPPPGYEREMARIAAREDRHFVPREMWTDRDWRMQREQDAKKRARRSELLANLGRLGRPVIDPRYSHSRGLQLVRQDGG